MDDAVDRLHESIKVSVTRRKPFRPAARGRPESIETSSLHLDILRDLKRIHSHICSAAYPVLEAMGELHPLAGGRPSGTDARTGGGRSPVASDIVGRDAAR
jgi:hypothetical protein